MAYELHLDQFSNNQLLLYGSPEHQGGTSSSGISVLGCKPLLVRNTCTLLQSKQLKGLSLLPLQFGLPASKHISLNRGCPCPRAGALWGLSMIPEPSVCSLEGKGWYLLSPSPPHSVLFKYLVEDDDLLSIEVCAYVCLLETQGKNHKHCDSHCY